MQAPRMPSVAAPHFGAVPSIKIPRSVLPLDHGVKTTFDADYLVPILVDEVLPGDTFNCRGTFFVRLNTPLKPILDNLYFETFFFFVPNRLLWTNWEKFCGAQTNPGDSIAYTIPTIPLAAGGPEVGTLADYFGLPTDMTAGMSVSSLHFRAYNMIYNTWFRDQNHENSLVVDVDDGPDTYADYVLKKRNKRADYFTTCLTSPQKGTAQSIGVGGTAPVSRVAGGVAGHWYRGGTSTDLDADADVRFFADAGDTYLYTAGGGGFYGSYDPRTSLVADLSSATAITINTLRQAVQIQALIERDARSGTRYTEVIQSHFRVTSPDFRLQRPEYLGGGSTPINIHPVPQTSATAGANPLGQLAAFGTAMAKGHGFNKSFTEHGVIIGLANVRADLTYSQGVDRMWSRSTRYDFYWPDLAHLGEQSVLLKEIYADVASGTSTGQRESVFGYQERYGEYRWKRSMITGVFRPAYATPLDSWHVSQEFSAYPTLNSTFIQTDTPVDRVVATPAEPHFYMDAWFDYKVARPMPVFGIPKFGVSL